MRPKPLFVIRYGKGNYMLSNPIIQLVIAIIVLLIIGLIYKIVDFLKFRKKNKKHFKLLEKVLKIAHKKLDKSDLFINNISYKSIIIHKNIYKVYYEINNSKTIAVIVKEEELTEQKDIKYNSVW